MLWRVGHFVQDVKSSCRLMRQSHASRSRNLPVSQGRVRSRKLRRFVSAPSLVCRSISREYSATSTAQSESFTQPTGCWHNLCDQRYIQNGKWSGGNERVSAEAVTKAFRGTPNDDVIFRFYFASSCMAGRTMEEMIFCVCLPANASLVTV